MHNKLLKWDPGDSLCGVGWGVGACGLGELSGLHKNPRQSPSSLQNIDNDIHEAKKSINRQNHDVLKAPVVLSGDQQSCAKFLPTMELIGQLLVATCGACGAEEGELQ